MAVVAVTLVAVGVVTVGSANWVTVIVCPSTERWAVRLVVPVLAVKEKLTTPLATLPTVSQDWSLLGAKSPVKDCVVGSTGSRLLEPAAAPTLTALPGTNVRGRSLM